ERSAPRPFIRQSLASLPCCSSSNEPLSQVVCAETARRFQQRTAATRAARRAFEAIASGRIPCNGYDRMSADAVVASSRSITSTAAVARRRLLVALACVLFLVQELPGFQSRWIEDESSYADAAWTFSREGRIR